MNALKPLQKEIDPYLEKLTLSPKKAIEAEDLSNEFLIVKSYLANLLYDAEIKAGGMKGLEKATFSHAVVSNRDKDEKGKELSNAAKEHHANIDKIYQQTIDQRSQSGALVNWLCTHIEIFSDAVVTFRKKGERLGRL